MKIIVVLCALLIQLIPTGVKSAQKDKQWRPGTYLGLTAGKSKRADVVRVLGEPKRLDTPEGQRPEDPDPEIWYVYERGGEFPGALTVVIDKRSEVVLRIDLNPDNLSKDDAIKHFGPDYILTRYDFDECLGTEEAAPLYESANGSLLSVEYRQRGIAASVNEEGKVNTISYVSEPVGARESKCKRSSRPKGQSN